MRDLNQINPQIAFPKKFCATAALLPLIMTAIGAVIASEATPHRGVSGNSLAVACWVAFVTSVPMTFLPILFDWDWKTKFFGTPLIYLVGPALLGIIPWLCVVFYSALPLWIRICTFGGYALPIFVWCRRFVELYREIFSDAETSKVMYSEAEDAIYYLQKGDMWLMERKFKFRQMPSGLSFGLALIGAFLTVPFASILSRLVGLPYVHIFLSAMGLPIVLMCLGLATRGYLIFYYYPWKLKRALNKEVYVDMDTKPDVAHLKKPAKKKPKQPGSGLADIDTSARQRK